MVERVFAVSFWFSILPVFVVPVIHHRYQTTNQDARDVYYNDNGVGLFPPIFNLAKHADISVNATCGQDRPEVFCRRPLDKEGRKSNQCKPMLCDGKKNNIRRATDGSKESWISPTLENGLEYEYVTVLLDMKQVYQVAYVTLKAGISPRPAAWVLERSTDGVNFTPWQYFADTDAECRKRFGLPATQGKPHYKTDDEVICTIYYSKLYPLENGEVHVSLLNGRPGLNTSSDLLKNFTLARYVRIRLQKMHKTEKDLALRKRLFYSIKTISIGGQCLCHGHASKCTPNSISGIPSCECEHHTCGKSCDECCPMFNQQLWSPGTLEIAGSCEACQCYGHAVACRYSPEVAAAKLSLDTKGQYRGGGECLNCTAHTTGVNCERCEKGWYRPLGIRPDDASPCVPCECHPRGSTGSCAYDDSQPGKSAGWCECREGYAGIKCDKCAPGRRNFPICEPCPCDQRGSHRSDDCSGPCICKANVEGENCDKCRPGFFALSAKNPEGCTKCYCSGVTDVCELATLTPNVTTSSLDGWLVTDLSTTRKIIPTQDPDTNTLYVGNYEFSGIESYYWLAPSSFCGNKISSYGEMTITFLVGWEAMRGDTSGQPTVGPNIILIGNNGVRLGHGEQIFEGRKGNATLSAPLIEDAWYIIPPEVKDIRTRLRRTEYRGAKVTRDQLLSVLADLKHVLLRAKFHTDQAEGSLLSVKLEHGITDPNSKDHFLEKCSCPPEYAGLSCESCAFSYYKDTNSSFDGLFKCLPCPCNGHSECDPDTGVCKKCEHNTQGDDCDVCLDGYYGDPTIGSPEDCKPCACPLSNSENNFSPYCELKSSENGSVDDYVCTACPQGFTGDHCELCYDGYYGNPLELGGGCKFCDCKGGPCDNITGQCLECEGNTEGLRCEKCKPLHYGNPLESDCKPCNCSVQGSENEICDITSGQCQCKPSFTGRACDRCGSGFGNVTAGCKECECGSGSKSKICDPFTGECECQPGTISPYCKECELLHYGLSSDGCQGCGCHIIGSQQAACDIVSGHCQCKPNVTGRSCDQCEDRHWGFFSGEGCQPCDCDPIGSIATTCDIETGQCVCKPGVGGRKCDSCLPNYFGFSLNGCLKCQECNLLGHICDPNTGRCVCPPHTQGVHCQFCAQNAWGYQKSKGCIPCNCDSGGSSKIQCDQLTGKCSCRKGFKGERCDSCDQGYYGYPFCKSCECDYSGTTDDVCDPLTEKCQCDENGTCPCKPNVMGKKCDECKKGTFGLQKDNPNGCTACFCFGRSASCTQAGLHWSQIRSTRQRSVSIEYDPSPPFKNTLPIDTQEICYINLAIPGGGEVVLNGADRGLNVTNNLRTIPGDTEDVKIGVSFLFDTPVYWKLPQQFLGDKVLSYGGYLRFVVESEGGLTQLPPLVLASYPLVQIQGNGKIVLEYFPLIPNATGRYEVRFHESLWREKAHPDRKVSRETMMVALQNLQHVLIRASDAVDFTKIALKNVSMDTAAASPGLALAGGVELCECPPQYNSTSCQDPSIGFYRWYDKNVHTATIVIQLIGEAKPCECNNRSSICDIESGYCQNCEQNTGGHYCERCGEGHYGDPAVGPCLSCPCPHPERNFATSCQVVQGRDPVCFCKPGYTGKYCDRCAYGWYGYPEVEGGSCQPCECDPYGSVSDECHEKTGQCNCRPGIEGKDCSICPWREVMTPKGCSTCEDGCTGILLKDFDNLSSRLKNQSLHILTNVGPPWKKLKTVEDTLNHIDLALAKWEDTSKEVDEILDDNIPHHLKIKSKFLVQQVYDIKNRGDKSLGEAFITKIEAEELLNKIRTVQDDLQTVISNLQFYSGEKGVVNDLAALMESQQLLEMIKARDFQKPKQEAERVLDFCTMVLNKTLYMNGGFSEMRDIRDRIRTMIGKLDELLNLTKKTRDLSDKRQIQARENRRRLKHLIKKIEHISMNLDDIEEIREEADDMLYDADQFLVDARGNLKNLTNIKSKLKNSTIALEKREKILYDLNPLYRSKYVKPSQEHADDLMRIATEYRDLLNTTEKDAGTAIEASKSYQDIVDDLQAAREIAEMGKVSAEISYEQIFPPVNEDSIIEKSSISKSVSSRLASRAINHVNQGIDLRRKLELEKNAVDRLEETVRETGVADNNLAKELQKFEDLKVRENIQNAMSRLENIENQMQVAKENVEEISRDVAGELRPQLDDLALKDDKVNLEKAHANIQESLRTNRRTIALLNKMNQDYENRKQRGYFQNTNNSLSNRLMDLKNKITEARHAAQSIRLSLSSNSTRGCVRTFKAGIHEPTTTTRLVVTTTVDPTLRNGIIFYLPSSSTSDFIALEIVDGNIRFVWNNGGGPGVVWKPLKPNPKSPKQDGPQWYKIIVERISYTVKLWALPDGIYSSESPAATNSSNPNYGRLDIGADDKIWIGGLPDGIERPPEILTLQQGLIGCLHSLSLDDRPLGLWDFYTDITDSCSACEKGADEMEDDSSYNFNGEGYSVLKHQLKSIYNKYQFSVALKFKTYDDNAILFLAFPSVERDRYVSLTIREGRIVFQIAYGANSQLEMSSSKTYNDGNWTIVEASRNFDRRRKIENGLLKVGEETKVAAPPVPPSQSQIPDLSGADYLVGGYPPGYNFKSANLRLPKSFLGCMADLFIDKEIYNPLRGRSHGVGSSCSDKIIKVAGFRGDGYLKLEATRLKKDSAFGLAIRTLQADAFVLLANGKSSYDYGDVDDDTPNDIESGSLDDKKRESYYSIALVDGRIEVRIDAGKGRITLVSQTLCNDGRFHSISVTKTGRKIELRVDDELQSSSTLPGGAIVVKAKDLYLGGVPRGIDVSSYASSFSPFVGTIKDMLFNYMLLKFDQPLEFHNVDLGRLGPEKGENSAIMSMARVTPPTHSECHRSRKYVLDPRAVKFGDSPNSHVQINLRRRNSFHKNFNIELDFRTFYRNGLLLMIPGGEVRENKKDERKNKQNFLILTLRNGQLQVIIRAKRKLELSSTKTFDDGVWHHVLISREERKLLMLIDSSDPGRIKIPKKVNLGNSIYIGGLPEKSLIPEHSLSKLDGFTGCVRNLKISNQTEDLIGEKSLHQRVGQCFPQVERGSYFSGDAFAIYKKEFKTEDLLNIELEFRTFEINGILLSISKPQGYPAFSMEINNGKIIMLGDIGDRRQFRLEHSFPTEFTVCDNKWHRIHLMYDKDEIIMRVDQTDVKKELKRNNYLLNAIVNAPMYIGGLPEHLPGSAPDLETRENFKGCMRSLVIGNEKKDFTEIQTRHNVLVGSCPTDSQQ